MDKGKRQIWLYSKNVQYIVFLAIARVRGGRGVCFEHRLFLTKIIVLPYFRAAPKVSYLQKNIEIISVLQLSNIIISSTRVFYPEVAFDNSYILVPYVMFLLRNLDGIPTQNYKE